MKILFATSLLPKADAASGYDIANRAIVHGMRSLGHEVVAMGFTEPGTKPAREDDVDLGSVDVVTARAGVVRKLGWLARAMRNRTTFAGAKLQVVDSGTLRSRMSAAGPFDLVVLNGAPIAAAFERVLTGARFAYVAHNLEHKSALESAAAARGLAERMLYKREARMLEALETRLAAAASHVFTLSDDDAAAFKALGARSASTVPLVASLEPQPPAPRRPTWDAGLIGTWSWMPNRIGLDWFCKEVMPLLPQDFSVAVAGGLADAPASAHPGLKFLGHVPSAGDFVRSAACLPLTSKAGTGIQLKTLEAFETGISTVATAASLRGIARRPANCVEADAPAAFAAALVKAALRGTSGDLDGRNFHAAQMAGMLSALAGGLETASGKLPVSASREHARLVSAP
jgi:hypothetical protein